MRKSVHHYSYSHIPIKTNNDIISVSEMELLQHPMGMTPHLFIPVDNSPRILMPSLKKNSFHIQLNIIIIGYRHFCLEQRLMQSLVFTFLTILHL